MSILSSVKIVEFEGLGPGPFCGMLLADLGADVIVVERKGAMSTGNAAVFRRGKRSIALNLKDEKDRDAARRIAAGCDALIEGMRPGVMERLGLGPDLLRADNKKLVYGRLTGWGQDGPWSQAAGHDINYVALSGAAWYSSQAGDAPVPAPTMIGDVAGGALYLALGILAGITKARETREGSVVDAAIVDGSAHMLNLLMSLRAGGGLPDERGQSMLDGAHFYDAYECADGDYISIGPLEPQFYSMLLDKLNLAGDSGLQNQFDTAAWPARKKQLADLFKSHPRKHWCDVLEGTDVCFAPILSPSQAAQHPHMNARKIYRDVDGVMQTAAAPRFDGAIPEDPPPVPRSGAHAPEILREAGLSDGEISTIIDE